MSSCALIDGLLACAQPCPNCGHRPELCRDGGVFALHCRGDQCGMVSPSGLTIRQAVRLWDRLEMRSGCVCDECLMAGACDEQSRTLLVCDSFQRAPSTP